MTDERVEVAEGHRFRRRGVVEALGEAAGRLLPRGAARERVRDAYHALLGRGGGISARLPGGERVRVLPEYRHMGWNAGEYAAFRAATRPGGVVLDVGANVGAYSVLFGRWVGPEGRVYAFEPAAAAMAGLRKHLSLNRVDGVVRGVHAAVSDRRGWAALAGAEGQGTARLAGEGNHGGETVATVTIDDFCAGEAALPTLIKIDVEGWELEALRGARETIARGGRELALFVEMHPTLWRERGIAAAELRAELEHQRLRAEPLRPVSDPWSLEGECLRLRRLP
jgi:FkbM family methyltransferase